MSVEIKVPTLGESVTEATVAKWFKSAGDQVLADEPLVELETDKVTLEVPSPVAGKIESISAEEGATVEVNALLGAIAEGEAGAVAAPPPPTTTPRPTPEPTPSPVQAAPAPEPTPAPVQTAPEPALVAPAPVAALSPAVRNLVAENALDPGQISPTGKGGRILKGDVLAHLAQGPTPAPATLPPGPSQTGPREERVPMSRIRQRIAEHLKKAQNTAAMLTTFNEVDLSAVIALRKQYKDEYEERHGVRLGFMSFFVKAAIVALREIPEVNAEIDGTDIVYKNHYDIGVAVGTHKGVVVPVVRDADQMTFAGIEQSIKSLASKARAGTLAVDDMRGGTFTITNGGVYGSMLSTPILNGPQSGILGMHNIQPRPMAVGDGVEVRPMMYTALSYDHRVVDGQGAVTFLVRIKECIEDPQRMLLDI
jgi:2-oxoglutarate dehydrogenase E2 component (dihydrolipoamide succinyltransferase)